MLKVIIDTDIGDDIDDAFALLCALANPEFDILGITTVFKNTPQRAKIVKDILKSVGREDIPVFAGIEVPLTGNVIKWDYENYGSDGKVRVHHYREDMSDYTYNEGSAVDFILETAKKYPNEVTLIALAPFTNIGEACKKDPKSFALLKEAYIMAGQPFAEYAEWNVRVDPYSAKTFFESGIDITCYPLNVTTKCKLYEKEIERVRKLTLSPNEALNKKLEELGTTPLSTGIKMAELIKRPEVSYFDLADFDADRPDLPYETAQKVETEIKYEGYIARQKSQVEDMLKLENRRLPLDVDYTEVEGLRLEAREKLNRIKPENIGQASRISGVSPSDISVLSIWTQKRRMENKQ